ncbi:MAG: hypothetical protein AVDCRST_MAG22-1367, partial [uncultured Rubrobacteraceae bacterium]
WGSRRTRATAAWAAGPRPAAFRRTFAWRNKPRKGTAEN